jgi:hypothetical protein
LSNSIRRFALFLFLGALFFSNSFAQNLLNTIPASGVTGSWMSNNGGFGSCSSFANSGCTGNVAIANNGPAIATLNAPVTVGTTYTLKFKVAFTSSSFNTLQVTPSWATPNPCTNLTPGAIVGVNAFQTYTCTITATANNATNTISFRHIYTSPTYSVNYVYIAEAQLTAPVSVPVASAVSQSVAYSSLNNNIALSATNTPTSVAVSTNPSYGTATASGTAITYTPTTGYFGTDTFQYTATNAGGTSSPATATITISPPTLVASPVAGALTAGTVGTAYSNVTLSTSGGASPYTYAVTTGSLPAGLSLSSGVISGTPTAAGTSNFTITATDSSTNSHATRATNYSIAVALATQATLNASTSPSSINTNATSTVSTTGGSGTGAVSYAVTSGTCTISGATVTAGAVAETCTVTATKAADSTYASTTATTSITVTTTPTPVLTFATPTSASVSMGASLTNTATSTLAGGSYGAISYSSATPAVATVDSSGVITPVSVGTSVITATQAAVTGVNAQATQTYTVSVNATPTPTLTFATQNTASVMLSGALTNAATTSIPSGGTISYTSSVPSVATVNASGVITPLTAGTSVITATQAASAGVNTQVSTTYTLTVNALLTPTLTFATPTAASVVLGGALTNAATSSNSGGSFGAISYSSSNTGVATVNSSSGAITTVAAGTSVITATQAAVAGVNAQATQTYTLTVQSTNAALSNLSLSSGALSPTFASGSYAYSASVTNATTSITVTPTVAQSNATVKVNNTTVASGSASGSISLSVGSNIITTVVTAQDGTTTQTYTTTVTRAAASTATLSVLTLSSGTLSPIFASGTASYTASVTNATSSITVTPTVTDTNSTVKVNGTTVASGSASGSISLSVGSNTITTVVTAQDGTTTQTYTTTVTRAAAASNDATLSAFSISSGTLSPTFASGTTSYNASVANSVSSITATPTRNQANATITVNGTAVTSGSASGAISLSVGSNTITTVVTAQDGTTTQTYTTTVTRVAALLAQASFTVVASPSALSATTTTSTLSTTGGSGTGAISYAMTTGTCTLSGTTVTAGTANETCTVTATKAADSTYAAATATVNITVSRRATLAAAASDASVGRTQTTQMMQTQKFVQAQVQNITSHLDTFRHNFNLSPSNMGVSLITPSMGPMTPLFYKVKDVWSGNTGESTASSLQKVGMKEAAGQANGASKPFNDYNNPDEIDEQAKIEERIYAYERKQETYSLWSAGTIDTGLFKTGDNKDISNKFRVNGLTFGLDYKVGPRAIVGAAFGIGQGTNASPELQSTVKSTQRSFSGYGMLGFGNNWVVDGLLGYSSLSFTGDRTTADGAATLGMSRTGNSAFASTSISKIFSFGSLRIAPFVREDLTQIRLGKYTETGAADYALGYDTTRYTATTASAGLHFSNDVYLDRGKLTTTAKFSGNRMKTGAIAQDVYYVDSGIAGGIYTLQQNSSYQSSRSLNLGITYSNKAGDGIDIGWMGAMGANQYKLNGLRFGMRFAM